MKSNDATTRRTIAGEIGGANARASNRRQEASSEPVEKVFFMVLFAGEVMADKISKICTYFGADAASGHDGCLESDQRSCAAREHSCAPDAPPPTPRRVY